MRLDGEHAIEGLAEQPAEDALGERLAGLEDAVLTHVGKIGGNQRQAPGATARASGRAATSTRLSPSGKRCTWTGRAGTPKARERRRAKTPESRK
jgi:hypothetical protein